MADDTDIKVLARLEGLSFEEAKLAFNERQDLPLEAFCGPNFSFPCHDMECIKESFSRLTKHKPIGWERIIKCVHEKAARFGVNLGFQESLDKDTNKILEWYLKKKLQTPEKECEECDD